MLCEEYFTMSNRVYQFGGLKSFLCADIVHITKPAYRVVLIFDWM
jgi:hypothetical protein